MSGGTSGSPVGGTSAGRWAERLTGLVEEYWAEVRRGAPSDDMVWTEETLRQTVEGPAFGLLLRMGRG